MTIQTQTQDPDENNAKVPSECPGCGAPVARALGEDPLCATCKEEER